ncbi:MAG: Gx transporter family protein [Limnochordia bacterium]
MQTSDTTLSDMLARCQRTARLGLLLSLAAVLHVIEAQLPSVFFLPGARLGLANLVSVLVICVWGWREGLLVTVLRQVLGGLFTGALLGPSFWFGLVGGMMSVLVMGSLVVAAQGALPTVLVSMAGAVAHNLGQLMVAYAFVRQPAVFAYWPLLLLFALPSGAAVGYLAGVLLPSLREELRSEKTTPVGWPNRLAAGLVLVVFVFGVTLPFRQQTLFQGAANPEALHVEVIVDGRLVGRLPLTGDIIYDVPLRSGHMEVSVSGGRVAVLQSDCPDQICVRTGRIERPNQAVICVPNRVVVRIAGKAETDIDAVSG